MMRLRERKQQLAMRYGLRLCVDGHWRPSRFLISNDPRSEQSERREEERQRKSDDPGGSRRRKPSATEGTSEATLRKVDKGDGTVY